MTSPSPYTVFGYGSLIFKPPPHVVAQTPGFLKGYVRRFAQSSNDHRGTLEDPGRVGEQTRHCVIKVTLIHIQDWDLFSGSDSFPHEDIVWGIAYTIDPKYAVETKEYLDYREKNGYTETKVDVWGIVNGEEAVVLRDASNHRELKGKMTDLSLKVTVYVGRPDNPAFVGSEPYEQLAYHIWSHEGPSGKNKDYLYQLSESIRHLAPESHDSHLQALETRVRALDKTHGLDVI